MSRTPHFSAIRPLLSLAWPVILARSTQSIIGFSDALMIAPFGEHAIAATTTGALNSFALVILPMGVAFIVQSFASQLQGKGDLLGARRYAWYGLILSALTAIISAAAIPLVGPVLSWFPYEPEVHRLMTSYIDIRMLGVGAVVAMEVLGNWYSGLGNTRLQMMAGVIAMVLNIFLNWVLIYGNLGAPAMGVEGAALASTIATWAAFGFLALVFALGRGTTRPSGKLVLMRSEFWRMLRFGVPNGINWFMEFAAFTLFINIVVADISTVALAAMMVVIQINSVSFMPAFGLASAGAILSGQAIGADRRDEVQGIVRTTASVAAMWQGAVGLVYLVIPTTLMALFTPPTVNAAELLAVGSTLLAISAAWQLFDALGMTLSETLRAAGDTAWCMWTRLTLAWLVFTPLSLITVNVLGGGPVIAILCMLVYIALLAAAFAWRFYVSRAWRHIDLTGSEIPVA